jgi:hypothetical protein
VFATENETQDRGAENADQDGAFHLEMIQRDDGEEANHRQDRGRLMQVADGDKRGGLAVMMPALCSAMIARNRPMPAVIARAARAECPLTIARARGTASPAEQAAGDEHRAQRGFHGKPMPLTTV